MKKLFNLVTILVIAQSAMWSGCALFQKQDQFAKQQLAAQEFYLQYPGELGKVCAQKFPVISGLDTGKWFTKIDTSISYSPSPFKLGPESDTVICKTDTVTKIFKINVNHTKVDTLKIKDTAAADSLKNFIAGQTDKVSKLTQQHVDDQAALAAANHTAMVRLWICIGIALLCLILLIVLIEKII